MRAEHQLSVQLGGDFFQIVCDDESVIAELRSRLANWLVEGRGLPGFTLNAPEQGNKMWVLLGSDAGVLGRFRDRAHGIEVLMRHLAALEAPKPERTHRVGLRALVAGERAVLLDPSIVRQQPFIERQLEAEGLSLLDTSFVLLDDRASEIRRIECPAIAPGHVPHTHTHPSIGDLEVAGLLWAGTADAVDVTPGQVVHALANATRDGSLSGRIEFAVRAANSLLVQLVDTQRRGSVVESAVSLLDAS